MTEPHDAVITLDEFLPHPPDVVWRALTDPDLVAQWWAAGDIRPVVGHRFALDMGEWGRQACEVVTVDEPNLLRFTFAEGSLDTTITWRLVPEGTGTRLFLEHAGFDLDSPMGKQAYDGMSGGWSHVVDGIGRVLAAAAR